jgi:hypothetical protein
MLKWIIWRLTFISVWIYLCIQIEWIQTKHKQFFFNILSLPFFLSFGWERKKRIYFFHACNIKMICFHVLCISFHGKCKSCQKKNFYSGITLNYREITFERLPYSFEDKVSNRTKRFGLYLSDSKGEWMCKNKKESPHRYFSVHKTQKKWFTVRYEHRKFTC